MRVCLCLDACRYVCVCTHACLRVCRHVCMQVCIYAHTRACVCVYGCLCARMRAHVQQENPNEAEGDEDEDSIVPAEELLAGRRPRRRHAKHGRLEIRLQVSLRYTSDRALKLLQYFLAVRRFFANERTVHISVDASRVGKRQRLLGFMSRPDGLGAWMPPQAIAPHPRESVHK